MFHRCDENNPRKLSSLCVLPNDVISFDAPVSVKTNALPYEGVATDGYRGSGVR
jgi:hypothetical protein